MAIGDLLRYSAWLLFGFSMLGVTGIDIWIFDLFNHFRFHYLFLALFLLLISFFISKQKLTILIPIMLTLLINTFYIYPYYLPIKNENLHDYDIKVISLNLGRYSDNGDDLRDYINKEEPDIIVLNEISTDWAFELSKLSQQFRFAKALVRNDPFGIGVISKYPLMNEVVRTPASERAIPLLRVTANINNKVLNIVAAHPFPPIGANGAKMRNDYLKEVSQVLQKLEPPMILCGDLNITPWSSEFAKLQESSKLNAITGFGLLGTWPTSLGKLALPIDHCLFSGLNVTHAKRGPNVGSDHYPIEIKLKW